MNRLLLAALATILLLGCTQSKPSKAPDEQKSQVFMLWESYIPMHKRLGPLPHHQTQKATEVFGPRMTSVGKVQVEVSFAQDSTLSHLTPDLRVISVSFAFDKDVRLRPALQAIEEARTLCAAVCTITGSYDDVVVSPVEVTQEQRDVARDLISKSNSDIIPVSMRNPHPERFVPRLLVIYRKGIGNRNPLSTTEFEEMPVDTIIFDVYDPSKSKGKYVRLKNWKP